MHFSHYYKSVFSLILLGAFLTSVCFADVFKCVDNEGNTHFKDSACSVDNKETKVKIENAGLFNKQNNSCTIKCSNESDICVADLGLGARNTHKNLALCDQSRLACRTACIDSVAGRKLEVLTAIERAAYERKIKNSQSKKEIDEYLDDKKKRIRSRDQKRKQKHCRRYENKLAKLKAKWKRKQQDGWTAKEETNYLSKITEAKDNVEIECR